MSCTEYKLAADDPYGLRNLSLTSHLIKSQTTSAPPQETAIIVLLINYWLITNKPWNQWHTLPIVHATEYKQYTTMFMWGTHFLLNLTVTIVQILVPNNQITFGISSLFIRFFKCIRKTFPLYLFYHYNNFHWKEKFFLQVILQTIKWYTAMNIPVEQLYIILQYLA